jgi:O-antigen ligase
MMRSGHRDFSPLDSALTPMLRARALNLLPVLIGLSAIPLSFLAAEGIVEKKRLALMLVLAVFAAGFAVLTISLGPEKIFVAWLFFAPFLQNSARFSTAGHRLSQVVYTLPPLLFLFWTLINRNRPRATLLDLLPFLYAGLAVTSYLLTRGPGSDASMHSILTTLGFAAVGYYFCAYGPVGRRFGERLVEAFLASVVVLDVMTCIEAATGWNLWGETAWHLHYSRSVATLDNPAVLGTVLAAAIVVAIIVVFWDGPQRLRTLSLVAGLGAMPAIVFTYTRGPFLGLFAAAVPLLLLRRTIRVKAALVLAISGFAFYFAWASFAGTSLYQQRVANGATVETRVVIQQWSFKLAREKPVLGWGYGSFDQVKNKQTFLGTTGQNQKLGRGSTSHDSFLTILVETGIVGLLVYLVPWAALLTRGFERARAPGPDRWLLLVGLTIPVVYALSAATFDMRFFSYPQVLPWLALGLLRRLTRDAAAA